MSDKIEKLVRMANQIADFFAPYPEEEAVKGVGDHIRSFWTKRMRAELADYAAAGGKGLHPQVLEAVRRAAAGTPAKKAAEGPKQLGQMASDAG